MRVKGTAAVLVVAAGSVVAAGFGGGTKVTLATRPPATVRAGTTWTALVNVSRDGRRLDGFRPVIEIQDDRGREQFSGTQVAPGVYRLRVVFPRVGQWQYRVKAGRATGTHGGLRVVPR
jgi:hypothetical protein